MWRAHLERLRPICPTCRATGRQARRLELGTVACADGDDLLEAVLVCPEPICQREHPIVDGIAVVVADLQSWATQQLNSVLRRDDLSPFMESLLGDAAGPDSAFDRERAVLSTYGRMHWGDLDSDESMPRMESFVQLVDTAFDAFEVQPRGVWIDLGCAVGRATLELARRGAEIAVGVDLNFSMLRVAERMRRGARARYPFRKLGLVYDRRDYALADVPVSALSFWCCDVGLLPFEDAMFDGALSLNVLDCVPFPLAHLTEMGRVLRAGASALLSSPYDWSATATSVAQWLGGHSQRADAHGSSARELRRVLETLEPSLVMKAERGRIPWRVYMHERASMDYAVHLLHLQRIG